MRNFLKRYFIPILFLLSLAISSWKFPFATSVLGTSFLLLAVAIAAVSIFKKHRVAYLQGEITRRVFVRNVLVEILGILVAMTLAGLLGRYIAQIASEQIGNNLTKIIAGIVIALLAGIGIGILIKQTWARLVR